MTRNSNNSVGRRAWAVENYARDEDAVNVLVRTLRDPRPRVAREARRAIQARYVVPRRRLVDLYAATRQEHTRIQVLALLARGERSESMVSLLDAAVLSEGKALRQACQHLADWLRTWAPLSTKGAVRLAGAIFYAEDSLPPALAARLWTYVREQRGLPRRVRASAETAGARQKLGGWPVQVFLGGRVSRRSYEMAPTWWGWCRGVLRV
jgi:hypothetical protein